MVCAAWMGVASRARSARTLASKAAASSSAYTGGERLGGKVVVVEKWGTRGNWTKNPNRQLSQEKNQKQIWHKSINNLGGEKGIRSESDWERGLWNVKKTLRATPQMARLRTRDGDKEALVRAGVQPVAPGPKRRALILELKNIGKWAGP